MLHATLYDSRSRWLDLLAGPSQLEPLSAPVGKQGTDGNLIPLQGAPMKPRPKSTSVLAVRLPDELLHDITNEATRRRISMSHWVIESLENRLKFMWGLRADWFDLRTLNPESPCLHCRTLLDGERHDA